MDFDPNLYSESKKLQFLKKSLPLQATSSQVHVIRVTGPEMKKLRNQQESGADPVADAVEAEAVADTFRACTAALDVEPEEAPNDVVNRSINAVLEQMDEDVKSKKFTAAASEAAFFLAFKLSGKRGQDGSWRPNRKLVGIACAYRAVSSARFDTHRGAFHNSKAQQHMQTLTPFFKGNGGGYPGNFKSAYLWVDLFCSNQPGVGKTLMNELYVSAVTRKLKGVLCVAFTPFRDQTPQSLKLLKELGFETVEERLRYTRRNKNGMLMLKRTYPVDLSGVSDALLCTKELTTRPKGSPPGSPKQRKWRC